MGELGNQFPYSFIINNKTFMSNSTLNVIKESFESWYNDRLQADEWPVSIVINYSDTQTLSMKAYHTVTVEVQAVSIRNEKSAVVPLFKLQENYNHGVTSEEEAKEGMMKKLLVQMFNYPESTVICKQ